MRLLLVEDEPDLGKALDRALTRSAYVVDWVLDGAEAWELLQNNWIEYEVAIFDWLVPGLSGVELCQNLRQRGSALPVLMLTAKDTEADKVMGLDAGADDYVVKPFGMAELLARLRALQRRSPQLQLPKLQVGDLVLDCGTRQLCSGEKTLELTHKEYQLIEYFMRHPNQIVTRDRLLYQLWEIGAEPESNVVAAQIRLLRRKLADIGRDRVIKTVYGQGYRFSLDSEN